MWYVYKETKQSSGQDEIKYIQFKFFYELVKEDYEKAFREYGECMSSELLFSLPIQELYGLFISLGKADNQGLFDNVKKLCKDLDGGNKMDEESRIKIDQLQQEKEMIAAEAERAIRCIVKIKEALDEYEQ